MLLLGQALAVVDLELHFLLVLESSVSSITCLTEKTRMASVHERVKERKEERILRYIKNTSADNKYY